MLRGRTEERPDRGDEKRVHEVDQPRDCARCEENRKVYVPIQLLQHLLQLFYWSQPRSSEGSMQIKV
jgi:hypothetical protein